MGRGRPSSQGVTERCLGFGEPQGLGLARTAPGLWRAGLLPPSSRKDAPEQCSSCSAGFLSANQARPASASGSQRPLPEVSALVMSAASSVRSRNQRWKTGRRLSLDLVAVWPRSAPAGFFKSDCPDEGLVVKLSESSTSFCWRNLSAGRPPGTLRTSTRRPER